ncbi:MAG: hypothetical protein methR_P0546 [Methyloprofundus sp.]|nr:MAG: hypothetical protein methR_P0546 [Methyloprofundus sp.]
MKTIPIIPESADKLVLVGCAILHNEVDYLIKKNAWHIETHYLNSALHNYLNKLSNELNTALDEEQQKGNNTLVFYGGCHPLMEGLLEKHKTCRTHGQNCIVMLLGYEHFMRELSKGAYFLLEDWALTWEPMITECFGKNVALIREIFHSSHQYMLALRTPCNGDFTQAAERAAAFVDLPLHWLDVDLQELESVMAVAIEEKLNSLK